MRTLVFCGNYERRILSEAMSLGRIYWSDRSLREMLRQISAADAVFVNCGHVDVEMLEDSPRLREIICPQRIWKGLDPSSVSALGVVALQMPDTDRYGSQWVGLFEQLRELHLGYQIFPVLNPEAYHHPDWVRMRLKKKE